jgi:hypothetical protein
MSKHRRPDHVPTTRGDYVARPTRDWAKYNDELRDRPRKVTEFLVDCAVVASWRVKSGHRGQPAYSDGAIGACYMLRAVFHLSLRATEGVVRSILEAAGLDAGLAPDYSTLSKSRGRVRLRRGRGSSPISLIDGTGISLVTHGPWVQHKWRGGKLAEHRFVRVTLVTDAATGAVLACVVTQETGEGTGEVSQFEHLVSEAGRQGATTIIGDGAYDTHDCYEHSRAHGVRLIAPPRVNAVYGLHPDRDVTLAQIGSHGMPEWKLRIEYHQRSRVESDIGALKASFGDVTRARTFDGARADVLARASVKNLCLLGAGALASLEEIREPVAA